MIYTSFFLQLSPSCGAVIHWPGPVHPNDNLQSELLWRQTELLYSPARRMLLYCCYSTSPPRPSPFGSFNVIQWGKHSQHPSQPANTIMTRNFIISVQPWRQSRPTIMGQWLWWYKIIGKITEYLTWKLAELATVYNNIKLSKFSQPFNIK